MNIKKSWSFALCLAGAVYGNGEVSFANKDVDAKTGEDAKQSEFQELGDPYKNIGGAYWGVGLGIARTQHKIEFSEGLSTETKQHSSSSGQAEISLLLGFGTAFHNRWYAGLEFEVFNRLKGKTADYEDGLHIVHDSNMSFNFEGRFGYLFPEHGNLLYLTMGVSRLFGRVSFGSAKDSRSSFGSFFPTVGLGVEHKLNSNWSMRADYRYVISSKDNEHEVATDSKVYKYRGKADRMSFRLSFIRSINNSFF